MPVDAPLVKPLLEVISRTLALATQSEKYQEVVSLCARDRL